MTTKSSSVKRNCPGNGTTSWRTCPRLEPPLHPGTGQPVGPDDLSPHLPHDADRAGGESNSGSSTSPRRSLKRSTASGGPRPCTGPSSWRKYLKTPARIYYQERGRKPCRQPQAQHRRGPGLLQQDRRDEAAHHRDRRGPVGQCAGLGLRSSAWSARSTW